jgi:hypothetical protein
MRGLLLFLLLSAVCHGQGLESYKVSPGFIHFLVQHMGTTSNSASDDPFVCDSESYDPKNLVKEVHPNPSSLYLTRIKPPQLIHYFDASDRVYDARKLFAKFEYYTADDGWILYNASKQQLHCYRLAKDDLRKFSEVYKPLSPIQLHSFITLMKGDDLLHQIFYHLPNTSAKINIGDYKVTLTSVVGKDKGITTSYTVKSDSLPNDLVGSLDAKENLFIPINQDTRINIVTKVQHWDQPPSLTPIPPLVMPVQTLAPKVDNNPILGYVKAHRNDLYLLFDLSSTSHSGNDPFAEPDYSTLSALTEEFQVLSGLSPVKAPLIDGISFKDDLCIDITQILEESGVTFSKKGWAIFNHTQELIICYCSSNNQDIIEVLFSRLCCGCGNPANLEISAHLVQLPTRAKIHTLNEILAADYKFLTSMDTTGRSGEKFSTAIYNNHDDPAPFEVSFEPTLSEDGVHLDLRIDIITPDLEYSTGTTLASEKPIALALHRDSTTATYLLLQATIRRNSHSH